MDTIFALASARGKSGVAVIRVSGPSAFAAGQSLAGSLPDPRVAAVRKLKSKSGEILDEALVLCFAAGHSFTGEKVVEFQLHGSVAVVNAVLGELSCIEGLRGAEAGEFSRRALENDRLDLDQIEGLGDLIEAETEAQRQQAVRLFSGHLGKKVAGWRKKLVRAAALIEATIDFADEEVPVDVTPEVTELLSSVEGELRHEVSGVAVAERLRDGFEVAIVGAPNVGKSTLLNYLAGRDAAITSEIAGTTRDVIEVRMELQGLPVTFLDTAGLRETVDVVEKIGVSRTRERAAAADLRVFLMEESGDSFGIVIQKDDICLYSKGDFRSGSGVAVSGKTGLGVADLLDRISVVLSERLSFVGSAVHFRHKQAIESALVGIGAVLGDGLVLPELQAEELRSAISDLDILVGRVDVEQILDEIFRSFCIGK